MMNTYFGHNVTIVNAKYVLSDLEHPEEIRLLITQQMQKEKENGKSF